MVRDLNEPKKQKHQQPSKCEPKKILVFSCSRCQKEFSFKEAYYIAGEGKIIKNWKFEDVFALSLYCKDCVTRRSGDTNE